MFDIGPQEAFPIVYQISDPTDTNTYYVQAVIRNSATGAVIQTVDLDNMAGGRFALVVESPNDPSGLGTYIDVTATVYTDSGYSVVSPNYQVENVKYRVQERWSRAFAGGGGYFPEPVVIDYEKFGKIVLEAFDKLPTADIPQTDFSGVYAVLDSIRDHVKGIKMPEMQKIDLEDHTKRIMQALSFAFGNIQFPELNLSPVLDAIKNIDIPEGTDYAPHFDKVHGAIKALVPKLDQYNKYAGFQKTITGLIKEHGGAAPEAPAPQEEKKINYDPRVKALFSGSQKPQKPR